MLVADWTRWTINTIMKFEYISHVAPMFLFLTLNSKMFIGKNTRPILSVQSNFQKHVMLKQFVSACTSGTKKTG